MKKYKHEVRLKTGGFEIVIFEEYTVWLLDAYEIDEICSVHKTELKPPGNLPFVYFILLFISDRSVKEGSWGSGEVLDSQQRTDYANVNNGRPNLVMKCSHHH